MEAEYDILIVGGGPAGSAAAYSASLKNYKTIIIDREKFPKDKTCGDAIAFTSIELLEKIGLPKEKIINDPFFSADSQIKLFCANNQVIEMKNNFFFTFPRFQFDFILWKNIPEKTTKLEETKIEKIERVNNIYEVDIISNNSLKKITARYIIGADGYSSFVKRKFFQNLNFPVRVASRYYVESKIPLTHSFDFYFLPNMAPGYFWIFKSGPNTFNTGVYLKKDEQKNNIFEIHQTMMADLFKINIQKDAFFTWPIPNNSDFSNLVKNNILLTGDAAGICDVFLGQGIDSALISGNVAINSIDYFENSNSNNYPLEEIYRYQLNARIGKMMEDSINTYEKIESSTDKTFEILTTNYQDLM